MFIDRKPGPDGQNYLWYCEWERLPNGATSKKWIQRIGLEPPPNPDLPNDSVEVPAICWSFGRTMGNIAVYSPGVLGRFPDSETGSDAILPCDFVGAGKFRNGADRWWCKIHQIHWGKKADIQDAANHGSMRCANYSHPMSFVKNPKTFDATMKGELGVWCGLGVALSSKPIERRPPRIHVHVRKDSKGPKDVDGDYEAISITVPGHMKLFGDRQITRINITPPAAHEYVQCVEEGRALTTIECGNCRFPHLDLGEFSRRPHKKHTCGNCGWDHTWSDGPVISNPLQRLHDKTAGSLEVVPASRKLNLDDYAHLEYDVWASTPAIVWTAKRPQETGIHVHVYDDGKEVINDTFSEVIFQGKPLDREELYRAMLANTLIEAPKGDVVMTM